jgi:hypothetical protein
MRWGMRRRAASGGGAAELVNHRLEQTIATLTAECRGLSVRLDRFEQRLDAAEGTIALALGPDRIEDLERKVADFTLDLPTHEDLLDVRLHAARLAGEVTRVTTELRAEIDQVVADRLQLVLHGAGDTRNGGSADPGTSPPD